MSCGRDPQLPHELANIQNPSIIPLKRPIPSNIRQRVAMDLLHARRYIPLSRSFSMILSASQFAAHGIALPDEAVDLRWLRGRRLVPCGRRPASDHVCRHRAQRSGSGGVRPLRGRCVEATARAATDLDPVIHGLHWQQLRPDLRVIALLGPLRLRVLKQLPGQHMRRQPHGERLLRGPRSLHNHLPPARRPLFDGV